ncbi:hypothetical protein KVT40_006333 [Elsinoe batatas]|uniref:BHLH domain-containing protein n=1 Tax=Elsinoe batatas TaxID=2601811 RepID=A0A8K0KYM2_9PEZI|nr:hypothetical protein KVT40_006333 [Elsinoe batatas]
MPSAVKRKRDQGDQTVPTKQPPAPEYTHASSFDPQYLQGPTEADLAEALQQHNNKGMPPSAANTANGQDASDTANAALHFGMSGNSQQEASFLAQTPIESAEAAPEPNFEIESPKPSNSTPQYTIEQPKGAGPVLAPASVSPHPAVVNPPSDSPPNSPSKGDGKLKVGTEEWAAVRRNNHKEVERRRRETINEGINELGKIVPGAERNKGSILSRAVMYITDLTERQKEMETKNNLEKMMFEQAIAEMSASGDKLKSEVKRLEDLVAVLRGKLGEKA